MPALSQSISSIILPRRTLNSAYYSIDGSCSLREKNRMRAVLAIIHLAFVLSVGRAGAHNTHYLTVRLVTSGWSDLPARIERPLLHRGSSASGEIRSVTTVETDLFGRLSLPVRALRVWFTARVERGPSRPRVPCAQSTPATPSLYFFVRFHVGSKEGINPRLITRPLGLEPI